MATTAPFPEPAVSVVMAVHNGLPYLASALHSIMAQTLSDIEIIVVDDASTDETPQLLNRLAADDGRLVVLSNQGNTGPGPARNMAIERARAPYVAIMDADDIARPSRLEVQKAYLDSHPDVVLSGARVRRIDANGDLIRIGGRPLDRTSARWLCRFNMPLVHPAVMFRRFSEDGAFPTYRPEAGIAEDYDLVAMALLRGAVTMIPDVLLDYRVHSTSLSGAKWRRQQSDAHGIALRVQSEQLPSEIVDQLAPFRTAYFDMRPVPISQVFLGLREMLTHDAKAFPRYRTWMRRQTAQLATAAMQRSGMSKAAILRAFLGPGRDFLPALGLRYLETQRLLPAALRSRADVG